VVFIGCDKRIIKWRTIQINPMKYMFFLKKKLKSYINVIFISSLEFIVKKNPQLLRQLGIEIMFLKK